MAAAPPAILDDLFEEILLRLPPDDPACLIRASLVCKAWGWAVSRPHFRRRLHELHRAPPVLGLLHDLEDDRTPQFIPTTASSFSLAAPHSRSWRALDCRHGRALLERLGSGTLLVWDLVTGDERHLPAPPSCEGAYNGTVLRAAGHTDHGDCRSCPFLVVCVFSPSNSAICACVWSSETGVWSEITSIDIQSLSIDPTPSALVGNTLYWQLEYCSIVEYDLDNHRLGLTEEFPDDTMCSYEGQIVIMPTEDGRLGLAGVEGLNLHLWSLMTGIDGLITWTHQRVIHLEKFLAPEVVATCIYGVQAVGFAEDAGVIFIYVHPSVYMIHLKSMHIEEVSEKGTYGTIIPYSSFYAPGITTGGGDDQAEMLSNN